MSQRISPEFSSPSLSVNIFCKYLNHIITYFASFATVTCDSNRLDYFLELQ